MLGQRGRAESLKLFKHFYTAELINSLLIPRDARHKIFLTLYDHGWTASAKAIHAGPLFVCLTLNSVYSYWLSTPFWFANSSFPLHYSILYFHIIWVSQCLKNSASNLFCFPMSSILNTNSTDMFAKSLLSKSVVVKRKYSGARLSWLQSWGLSVISSDGLG